MADDVLKEDDEQLDIVEVDKLPTAEELAAAAAGKDQKAESDEDDDDGHDDHDDGDNDEGDKRLAEDHSDDGDDAESANRKKRLKRRQAQKEARARADRVIETLAFENRAMHERLARLEGTTVAVHKQDIDDRLAEARRRVAQAESIHGKAIESGNGEDAVEALRLRDEARDEARALEYQKTQLETPAAPQVDKSVQNLSNQWRAANPWYDGESEESLITNAIDARVKAEGFDPRTPAYWEELTKRVTRRLGVPDDEGEARRAPRDKATPEKKKAPPMGQSREHAPSSTRREVYVTPERKQAMQEAGIWDDPVRRARVLKAYAEHDRNPAS